MVIDSILKIELAAVLVQLIPIGRPECSERECERRHYGGTSNGTDEI